jgi:DNA-binding MarR family transcriptional regulator
MDNIDNIGLFKYFGSADKKEIPNHLTPTERHVALSIALHRNPTSILCCPGIKRLASVTGYNPSTIVRAVKSLCAKNELIKIRMDPCNLRSRLQYFFIRDIGAAVLIFNQDGYCDHFPEVGELFERAMLAIGDPYCIVQ